MKKLLFTARNFRVLMFLICLPMLFFSYTIYPLMGGIATTGWQYIFGVNGSGGNPILILLILIPIAGIVLNFLLRSQNMQLVASLLLAAAGAAVLFFLFLVLSQTAGFALSNFTSGWCISLLMYALVLGNCIFNWHEYRT